MSWVRIVSTALGLAGASLGSGCTASIGGNTEPDAAPACEPDHIECPDGCVDPAADEAHCGATGCFGSARGVECTDEQGCVDGVCIVVPLGSVDRPAPSCRAILDGGFSTGDGTYWVDPDDAGESIQVHCDMTTDGGGWTYWAYAGMRAYWTFDGATPANADIGNYAGTLEGGASRRATVIAPGFGSSVQFDNPETDRLTLTSGVPVPSRSSFAFWTRHTSCVNNKIPIYFADTSYMGDLRYGSGQLFVFGNLNLAMGTKLPGNCEQTIGDWVHHVYVDDGTTLRYFRNGVNVLPDVYTYRNLDPLVLTRIGSRPDFNTNGFVGQIDDVAVFERALTATEIDAVYRQGVAGRPLRWR